MILQVLIYILILGAGCAAGIFFYRSRFSKSICRVQQILSDLAQSDPGKRPPALLDNDALPAEFTGFAAPLETLAKKVANANPKTESEGKTEERSQDLRKIIDHLNIINELGQKLTSSLNLTQTFDDLYRTINSLMDAAVLELAVFDDFRNEWKRFYNDPGYDGFNNHMAEWSLKNRREVFLEDAERDFGRYVFQPLLLPNGQPARSVMVFPIIEGDRITGTLTVISFKKNSFESYHQQIVRSLLGFIAVAMANALTHDVLNRTKLRAEQSEKFKEQFLANMSHEIRTPINAVTGMTRLLLEKQPREDQLRYLESIRNASDSLLVIINDILDLSKIEAGKVELERIDFSVRDVLQNVRDIMQFKAEEKGLMLSVQADDSIPKVLIGDPTRLSQILINLVGNAVKFTEKGSVTVNATSGGITEATAGKKQALIHFSVSDTGIGMTPEQQSKLFMDYSQASAETSRKYGGTGLGLSISRQLVQLQGGTISVRSVAGEGSTFSFAIAYEESLSTSVSSQSAQVPAEKLGSLKGIRILIADDNEYNRIVARETLQLKLEAVHIDEAIGGLQAVELLRGNRYDIVLMDLVMPGMDGVEAARYIRTQMPAPASDIPILALTASVIRSEIDKCMEAGMNGFVPKPFKPHELLGAIYNALTGVSGEGFREPAPSAPTAANPYSAIDLAYLNEFTEGDQERLDKFITLFLSKVPLTLETIEQAMTESDFDKVRIAAHSLKPQLRFTGVQQGLEMAEEIEQYCAGVVEKEQLRVMVSGLTGICKIAFSELELVKNGRVVS